MSSTFVDLSCNIFQVINFSTFHFLNDHSSKSSEFLIINKEYDFTPSNCMDYVQKYSNPD